MLISQKYEIKSQISYKRLKFNITKYIYQHTKHIMSLILVTICYNYGHLSLKKK